MSGTHKARRRLLTLSRVGVTLLAMFFLFWIYKPGDVVRLVASIGLPAYTVAVALCVLCMLIGAWKWGVIIGGVPFVTLLRAVTAACFYSILPSGQLGGELSKVLIIRASQPNARNVMASVMFDKMTGVLGLLIIGISALLLSTHAMHAWKMYLIGLLALGCVCSLLAAPALASLSQKITIRHAALQGLQRAIGNIMHSVAQFSRNPKLLAGSITLGVLSQGMIVLIYLVIARALHIGMPSEDIIAAVVLANLAALLPISAGGFGIREAGLTALLAREHGVSGEQSLALSLTAMSIFLLAAVAGSVVEMQRLFMSRRAG